MAYDVCELSPGHDALLANGAIVQLRAFCPEHDGDALRRLYAGLSDLSIYLRWFSAGRTSLERDVERMTSASTSDGGPPRRWAVVGERHGRLVGIGGWERLADPSTAEVAFVVEESTHGLGLATLLLEQLAAAARGVGISTFVADVLSSNPHMVRVFRDAGFVVTSQTHSGVINLAFGTGITDATERVLVTREASAERRSLKPLLQPRDVAIMYVDERTSGPARAMLRQLNVGGYTGRLEVARAGSEVPAPADLVIYPDSAGTTPEAMVAEATRRRAGALLVLGDGGRRDGATQEAFDARLIRGCRENDIRLVGPGSCGIASFSSDLKLDATCALGLTGTGVVGLVTQSTPEVEGPSQHRAARDLDARSFISLGRDPDVSCGELLEWWESDAQIRGCGVQVGSIAALGDPMAFARIGARLAARKPIVTYVGQPGRQPELLAAYLCDAGVIQVGSMRELRDTLTLAVSAPPVQGSRVSILSSRSDTDEAESAAHSHGLTVIAVSSVPAITEEIAATMLRDEDTDALVIIPAVRGNAGERSLLDVAWRARDFTLRKPTLLIGPHRREATQRLGEGYEGIPRFTTPAAAIIALAQLVQQSRWRADRLLFVDCLSEVIQQQVQDLVNREIRLNPQGGWIDSGVAGLISGLMTPTPETAEQHSLVAEFAAHPLYGGVITRPGSAGETLAQRRWRAILTKLTDRVQDIVEIRMDQGDLRIRLAETAGNLELRGLG